MDIRDSFWGPPPFIGEEQFCKKGVINSYNSLDYDGNLTYGGYSQKIVVKEDFVVRIPDSLELDVASPLLCACITTYSPLKKWNAGPGKKVAIVGMGGLGHLAVQFAHAMGAEVTVLSQSLNKKSEALELGADHYFATGDPVTFTELASRFDLILNTVSANLDVDTYLSLLRVDGTLVNVGAPTEPESTMCFPCLRVVAALPVHSLVGFGKHKRCSISPLNTALPLKLR